MTTETLIAIVKKNVNVDGLLKDLAGELIVPFLEGEKAKIASGEVDLIKGTSLDAVALTGIIDLILSQVKAK